MTVDGCCTNALKGFVFYEMTVDGCCTDALKGFVFMKLLLMLVVLMRLRD